ncbi:YcaO-like family protein [Pseudomonas sp. K2I15]|uniref:YcaO-like family protein n=1 Tax=unclassified Pseudomonas TaxID=196821 RepID=UPI000B4CAB84|nr:YcaO-like family protein [Pseudomonas sp. K2I15]OWP70319.1 hypothetical protein CEC48_18420 [Pseudomonas sp. K2I15]
MSERELAPTDALLKIKDIIHSLGLNAVTQYANKENLVATAELYDGNNHLLESGAGKGPDSLIGALAESLEHFIALQPVPLDLASCHCKLVATQTAAKYDGFLSSLSHAGEPLECLTLTTLNKREKLFVPHVLLCPAFVKNNRTKGSANLRFLARYSSNSGMAFGCTENEALLHGIHEVIERHILSRFFMAICKIGPPINLYSPSDSLLAKALQNKPYAIESARRLQIIIIKDFLDVYFAVAFPKSGAGDLHIASIGSGCSLDVCIALQRAVTEQFQADELYGAAEEEADRKTLEMLSSSEKLQPLIEFSSIKSRRYPFIEDQHQNFSACVSQQLKKLQSSLSNTGKQAFFRTLAKFSNGCIVVQIYIPGLERFNIIRSGNLVAPHHILLNNPALAFNI